VTVDGHRINDSVFDSGTIGREGMVDVALIDRVEIIRGPSSSVYGSSAFFGVINIVTKRGAQFDAVEVSGEGGSLDTRAARLTYGSKLASGAQFVASASHYESGGVENLYFPEFDPAVSDDVRAANGGRAVGLDDERAANLFTSLQWRDLSFSGFYSRRYKQVPLASFGTIFSDPREETWD
jgi:outer membrane receptor for ferrienterochelin and colicins